MQMVHFSYKEREYLLNISGKFSKNIEKDILKYISLSIHAKDKFLEKNNLDLLHAELNTLNNSDLFNHLSLENKKELGSIADNIIIADFYNNLSESKSFFMDYIDLNKKEQLATIENNTNLSNLDKKVEKIKVNLNSNKITQNLLSHYESFEDKFIKAELFKMELLMANHITHSLNPDLDTIEDFNKYIKQSESLKSFIVSNGLSLNNLSNINKSRSIPKSLTVKNWQNAALGINNRENIVKNEESMYVYLAKEAEKNLDPENKRR